MTIWQWLAGLARGGLAQRGHGVRNALINPAHAVPAPARHARPNDVFTPTRPRAGRRTLVGRADELAQILDALLDDAAHVVLYSERGRGKTSLANLAVERLRRRDAIVARYACEAESTFDTILRGLARDLPRSLLSMQPEDADVQGCEGIFPQRPLHPADIAAIPAKLSCSLMIFVVDEFDRVVDPETRTRLADTIKLLADRALPLRFMIVGVSETLEQIIGQHPSIQRAIAGVYLPLLKAAEVAEMLERGGAEAGLTFGEDAIALVSDVAGGMPYMAQLLGLRITQATLKRGGTRTGHEDLVAAVDRLLADTSPTIVTSYMLLTNALPGMDRALRSLADAEHDPWARMTVSRTGEHMLVGGVRIPRSCWTTLLQTGVLEQPDGPAGLAHIKGRPIIYHVRLLAAQSRLACGDTQAGAPVRLVTPVAARAGE